MMKKPNMEQVYYEGFARLSGTRPKDEDPDVFLRYIARKYMVDFQELKDFDQAKRLEFNLTDDDDRFNTEDRERIRKLIFPPPDWAADQTIRGDRAGLVEDTCEHGTGHPNIFWMERQIKINCKYDKTDQNKHLGTHGCDGCCSAKERRPPTYDDPWDAV
jgi:hypothetical protein